MDGDLTLQVLLDASLDGYIRKLDIRPFERKSVLKLNMALKWYFRSRKRLQHAQTLYTFLAAQICMAIGNKKEYKSAVADTLDALKQHEDYLFIGTSVKDTGRVSTSWQADLARMWEQMYGMSIAEANRQG